MAPVPTCRFKAPWCRALAWMSGVATLLCGAMVGAGIFGMPGITAGFPRAIAVTVPSVVFALCLLSIVRGYVLTEEALLVQRPLWTNRIDLSRISEAYFDPTALAGSIRLFGNGGFFSVTGLYRNSRLGLYRLYGTDMSKAVVLRFPGRTVVVTPESPEAFLEALSRLPRANGVQGLA